MLRRSLLALSFLASLALPAAAQNGVPYFPQNLPPSTIVGRLPLNAGPPEAIPFSALLNSLYPTPTRTGDIIYWSGTAWVSLPGNNSGTNDLQENSSGAPSWVQPLPAPTRAGDIIYWNGSAWVSLPGNASGTNTLQETSGGVPSWVTPTSIQQPGIVSLSSCMNAHYGVSGWSYYTGQGTGTDIEPALDACLQTIRSNGRGIVWIDPGPAWAIKTGVPAADLSGNYLVGAGSQASVVVAQMSSGAVFDWSGAGGYTGGGIRGIGLLLDSGLGNTSTTGILNSGNSSFQGDQWELDDVYMSAVGGSSHWYDGVDIDGSARTTPQGVRVGSINNLQIFNCQNFGFFGSNLVQWTITNVGTYTGLTSQGMDFYITGGGTTLTNSTQVTLSGIVVGGTLNLNNNSNIGLTNVKTNNLTASTTATYNNGYIAAGGTISGSFGTGSSVTVN